MTTEQALEILERLLPTYGAVFEGLHYHEGYGGSWWYSYTSTRYGYGRSSSIWFQTAPDVFEEQVRRDLETPLM